MRKLPRTVFSLILTAPLCVVLVGGCGDDDDSTGDFCQDNCEAVVAAGCTDGPTDVDECLTGCNEASTDCPTEFAALASCAGSNSTFSCNDYDSPEPSSCADENAALQACLMNIDTFCYQVCPAVVAPGCTNGPTDLGDCLSGCNEASTDCPTQFAALASCAGPDSTFSCDQDDSPAPDGCETENTTLNTCLEE